MLTDLLNLPAGIKRAYKLMYEAIALGKDRFEWGGRAILARERT
jgi:hypothetical protein